MAVEKDAMLPVGRTDGLIRNRRSSWRWRSTEWRRFWDFNTVSRDSWTRDTCPSWYIALIFLLLEDGWMRQHVSRFRKHIVSNLSATLWSVWGSESWLKNGNLQLTRKTVQRIHMVGGSFLGVSRGCPPLEDIVSKLEVRSHLSTLVILWPRHVYRDSCWYCRNDCCSIIGLGGLTLNCNLVGWYQEWKVNMFFVIGGNGSHAGANAIYQHVNIFSHVSSYTLFVIDRNCGKHYLWAQIETFTP